MDQSIADRQANQTRQVSPTGGVATGRVRGLSDASNPIGLTPDDFAVMRQSLERAAVRQAPSTLAAAQEVFVENSWAPATQGVMYQSASAAVHDEIVIDHPTDMGRDSDGFAQYNSVFANTAINIDLLELVNMIRASMKKAIKAHNNSDISAEVFVSRNTFNKLSKQALAAEGYLVDDVVVYVQEEFISVNGTKIFPVERRKQSISVSIKSNRGPEFYLVT